jgi:hypothetical protein
MLLKLEPNARALADYMSELSEEAYCAGWMHDLEYELWEATLSGPKEYGRLMISWAHIARLKLLSAAAGGWIIFDEVEAESLMAIDEWQNHFREWKKASKGRVGRE